MSTFDWAKVGERLGWPAGQTAEKKYNENQPRAPKGDPDGGKWVSQGGGSTVPEQHRRQIAAENKKMPDAMAAVMGGDVATDDEDMPSEPYTDSMGRKVDPTFDWGEGPKTVEEFQRLLNGDFKTGDAIREEGGSYWDSGIITGEGSLGKGKNKDDYWIIKNPLGEGMIRKRKARAMGIG